MYGDEESGVPPGELYGPGDAEEAYKWAVEVFQVVSRLFKELSGST
jgi:HEPN domain-containing protein